MNRLQRFRATLAVATIALLLAGCSTLPTEPEPGPLGSAPVSGEGAVTSPYSGVDPDPDGGAGSGDGGGSGSPSADGATGASQTKSISRLLGGVVQAGRFKVIVPPLALRRNAVITVHQPDLTVNKVNLEISPASANAFLLPVLLVADCSYMPRQLLSLQSIWWWNPGANRWEFVVTSQVDLVKGTVTAALKHFSTYKVDGKAGW